MQSNNIKTKWGSASISEYGYYVIKTRKEGNHGKLLHRLIFEDFYGEIPEGFHVHHKNGNKLDCCILNLQLIRKDEHNKLHKTGINLSKPHKSKISKSTSKSKNTTGYYRVQKATRKDCKQGFTYKYRYFDENNVRKSISRININDLKEEVLKRGLEWIEY